MPEHPEPKARPHPAKAPIIETPTTRRLTRAGAYAELQVTTNFTFLTGASHPEELVRQAAEFGHVAASITDRNTLAGIVRAHVAAKEIGIPLAVGCCVETSTAPGREPLRALVYPTSRASYAGLCRLLTRGKLRAEKGQCDLALHDLIEFSDGLLCVMLPPKTIDQHVLQTIEGLRGVFDDDRFSIAASRLYTDDDAAHLRRLADLSAHAHVPLAATNDVHYHTPMRRPLQDALLCIRHGCTIHEAGFRLFANAERFLKPPDEMDRLFGSLPGAVERSVEVALRASAFSLDELKYEYPEEACPPERTPMQHLKALTLKGARQRYGDRVPERVLRQVQHEFELIEELNYAPYFLTVCELVDFARGRNILCQGRGAAANSAVCYCLGVTAVDPERIDILFERFVSRERNEPPDIDIDFEHERREEVIQHIYEKYGRDRAGLTAEVISYRGRSAVRDMGKAMGLSVDLVDRMAKSLDWWDKGVANHDRLREIGLNPEDPTILRVMALSHELMGFPRHLSQHVGGFVITRSPLCDLVPIENARMADRTVIEWDKDDIDAMGMLKVDVLGLGMMTCIRKTIDLINDRRPPEKELRLHAIPPEDPEVYDMICKADTIGVFQIESRAQMTMLPRLRPCCFYDLVIEVAIVRPGPIQGDMVHPYLRRRNGEEPVEYPNEAVRKVLGKTLGVPLFQEQAMAMSIVAAGFTPGEADQLRRAMAAWKRKSDAIAKFGEKLISGMIERGYTQEYAERSFRQLRGFSEYGFPESHAASFALMVYVSAWLKRHQPAAFAAGLLNSQPMGFYAPAQIVRDAQDHGVCVQPVDAQISGWDCSLEGDAPDLRLGMRLVKGLHQDEAERVTDAVRRRGGFNSIEDLWRESGVRVATLRRLASADAYLSMGLDRQQAMWQIRALRDEKLPIFDQIERKRAKRGERIALPAIPAQRQVVHDYASVGLSLKAHPVSFLREQLDAAGVTKTEALANEAEWKNGDRISVAGVTLVRQRPATASGMVFITIEDETGVANLILRPKIYARDRKAARHGVILLAHGHIERQGSVIHVLTHHVEDATEMYAALETEPRNFR